MTPRARRNWKILYWGVVPAAVFALDAAIYILIKGWQYNVKDHGSAAFWPGVLRSFPFVPPRWPRQGQ